MLLDACNVAFSAQHTATCAPACHRLQTVGRTALGLIEEVTGQYNRGGMDGSTGSTGSGLRAASDPHQFEDFFYLYGETFL